MGTYNYAINLRSSQWKAKANHIRIRDKHRCKKCKIKGVELHVHHKYYIHGREPWEYPDSALTTLCESCHHGAHAGKDISEFYKKARRKNAPVKRLANKKESGFIMGILKHIFTM